MSISLRLLKLILLRNLTSVLTEILMTILYSMLAHFTLLIQFYIVKYGKHNFVNTETKLQKTM